MLTYNDCSNEISIQNKQPIVKQQTKLLKLRSRGLAIDGNGNKFAAINLSHTTRCINFSSGLGFVMHQILFQYRFAERWKNIRHFNFVGSMFWFPIN